MWEVVGDLEVGGVHFADVLGAVRLLLWRWLHYHWQQVIDTLPGVHLMSKRELLVASG